MQAAGDLPGLPLSMPTEMGRGCIYTAAALTARPELSRRFDPVVLVSMHPVAGTGCVCVRNRQRGTRG